jgi:hypothetical protein
MVAKDLSDYISGTIKHKPELAHESRTQPSVQKIGRAPSSG